MELGGVIFQFKVILVDPQSLAFDMEVIVLVTSGNTVICTVLLGPHNAIPVVPAEIEPQSLDVTYLA